MMKRKQRVLLVRTSYLPGPLGLALAPPLGLLTLAAVLRKERPGRIEVSVVDTGINRYKPADVGRIIKEWSPDVLGISSYSLEAGNLHAIAAIARSLRPDMPVVAGGPHSTSFYDMLLKDPNVDYAVVGEGESTFVELLDRLHEGAGPDGVKGIAYHSEGELLFTGNRPYIEDLDSIPMPAWDLIDIPPYSKINNMSGMLAGYPYATFFSSRACPYRCISCHSIFGKKFRAQSPEKVIDEIQNLSTRFGVREVQFYDDVFNFDRERVLAIMEGIAGRGINMKFSFPNGVRSDIMNRDVIKAMRRAGTYAVTYAIETASPRLQRMICKNLNLDKAMDAIEWTYNEGVIPCGFFMFGFPTETRDEMEQTLDFAVHSRMLKALFFSVAPFPRTEMNDLVKRTYPDFDYDYDFSSSLHYRTDNPYYTKVSGIDIAAIQKHAWLKFYTTPWRVFQIFKRYPKNMNFLYSSVHGFLSNFLAVARPDKPMREMFNSFPPSGAEAGKS